jgi:hypothetical protein
MLNSQLRLTVITMRRHDIQKNDTLDNSTCTMTAAEKKKRHYFDECRSSKCSVALCKERKYYTIVEIDKHASLYLQIIH